jgi:DNA-binding GntR family transcriptional regulator
VAEAFNGQIRLLISTSARLPGRLATSMREHETIVEAVRRRDPASAESAMRDHVRQAGLAVLAHLRAAPPSPAPTGPGPTVS